MQQPFMLSWTWSTSTETYSEYFDSLSDVVLYVLKYELVKNPYIKDVHLSDTSSGYAFQIVNIV